MTTRGLDPGAQRTPPALGRVAYWEIDQESLRRLVEGLGNGDPSVEWFALRREFAAIALNPGFDRLIALDCNTIKELPHALAEWSAP